MINAVCNSPSWSSPSRESPAGAFEPWHSPEGSLRDDILPRGTLRHACPQREIVRNDLSGMVFSLVGLSIVKLSGMDALSQSSPSWDAPTFILRHGVLPRAAPWHDLFHQISWPGPYHQRRTATGALRPGPYARAVRPGPHSQCRTTGSHGQGRTAQAIRPGSYCRGRTGRAIRTWPHGQGRTGRVVPAGPHDRETLHVLPKHKRLRSCGLSPSSLGRSEISNMRSHTAPDVLAISMKPPRELQVLSSMSAQFVLRHLMPSHL